MDQSGSQWSQLAAVLLASLKKPTKKVDEIYPGLDALVTVVYRQTWGGKVVNTAA